MCGAQQIREEQGSTAANMAGSSSGREHRAEKEQQGKQGRGQKAKQQIGKGKEIGAGLWEGAELNLLYACPKGWVTLISRNPHSTMPFHLHLLNMYISRLYGLTYFCVEVANGSHKLLLNNLCIFSNNTNKQGVADI